MDPEAAGGGGRETDIAPDARGLPPQPAAAEDFVYKAFISYSHAADHRLAPVLQSALQRFATPWYRLRTFKVFRDETNLAVTPGLWPSILRALSSSEFFILLASEQAAQSKWVRQEIAHWLQHRGLDRLLVVQTSGTITWSDAAGDFDWSKTTALPDTLRGRLASEPFVLDLSWAHSPIEQLSLRHSRFRGSVLKLVAALTGREMADLDGEEVRQYRSNRRTAWVAGVALLVFAVAAAGAAVAALVQRAHALAAARVATSQRLAAQSASARGDQQLDLALLLSAQALAVDTTLEARGSLLDAFSAQPLLAGFLQSTDSVFSGPAFTPDGRRVVAGTGQGGLSTWALDTRRATHEGSRLFPGPVLRSELSPDGRIVAVSVDSIVYLWDLERHALGAPPLRGHHDNVFARAFSADGRLLATASQDTSVVLLWEVATGRRAGPPLAGPNDRVNDLAFSPDGALLAIGGETNTAFGPDNRPRTPPPGSNLVTLYDVRRMRPAGRVLAGHAAGVSTLAFARDAGTLASGDRQGEVIVWDLRRARPRLRLPTRRPGVNRVALSPAGDRLAVAARAESAVLLWSLADSGQVAGPRLLRAHRDEVESVAFSPDGARLASLGRDWKLALWDLRARHPLARALSGPRFMAPVLALAPGGALAATAGDSGSVVFWDVGHPGAAPVTVRAHAGKVNALAFSGDGAYLASAAADGTVALWSAARHALLAPPLRVAEGELNAVAFRPGGDTLAAGGAGPRGVLVSARSRRVVGSWPAHAMGTMALAFNPAGTVLATGGLNGELRFWNADTLGAIGGPVATGQQYVKALAFSPDGRVLASGGQDGTIQLFDTGTHAPLGRMDRVNRLQVSALAFRRDGLLASGSLDGTITLWDVARRTPIGSPILPDTTAGHVFVTGLAFDSAGTLASTYGFDVPLLWRTAYPDWARQARIMAGRPFTAQERQVYLGPGR